MDFSLSLLPLRSHARQFAELKEGSRPEETVAVLGRALLGPAPRGTCFGELGLDPERKSHGPSQWADGTVAFGLLSQRPTNSSQKSRPGSRRHETGATDSHVDRKTGKAPVLQLDGLRHAANGIRGWLPQCKRSHGNYAPRRWHQPLMTPIGRSRATFLERPALWTTSTTKSTSLYALGCSSGSSRRLRARAMIPIFSSSWSICRP
jgi:hypothetical protein